MLETDPRGTGSGRPRNIPSPFPKITDFRLIAGGFAVYVVLPAIPLILLYVMNPILITMHNTRDRNAITRVQGAF